MPRNTPISEISRAALEGIENAFTSYEEISGTALDYAPEYFLTCEIAKAIGKVSKGCIHLEESISGTLSDAGAVGPGKPKSSLKKMAGMILWFDTPMTILMVSLKLNTRCGCIALFKAMSGGLGIPFQKARGRMGQ